MTRLLERLASYAEFDICIFGNECILNTEIEAWPVVDALIAFYSDGFPLQKCRSMFSLFKRHFDLSVRACRLRLRLSSTAILHQWCRFTMDASRSSSYVQYSSRAWNSDTTWSCLCQSRRSEWATAGRPGINKNWKIYGCSDAAFATFTFLIASLLITSRWMAWWSTSPLLRNPCQAKITTCTCTIRDGAAVGACFAKSRVRIDLIGSQLEIFLSFFFSTDCSSAYYENENSVRLDASYIYGIFFLSIFHLALCSLALCSRWRSFVEEMLPTPRDIKVYTVGKTLKPFEILRSYFLW